MGADQQCVGVAVIIEIGEAGFVAANGRQALHAGLRIAALFVAEIDVGIDISDGAALDGVGEEDSPAEDAHALGAVGCERRPLLLAVAGRAPPIDIGIHVEEERAARIGENQIGEAVLIDVGNGDVRGAESGEIAVGRFLEPLLARPAATPENSGRGFPFPRHHSSRHYQIGDAVTVQVRRRDPARAFEWDALLQMKLAARERKDLRALPRGQYQPLAKLRRAHSFGGGQWGRGSEVRAVFPSPENLAILPPRCYD